jgi:hypothetical protein
MAGESILVWEITFWKMDDNGDEVRDKNGDVQLFHAPDLDFSHIAEYPNLEDLVPVETGDSDDS